MGPFLWGGSNQSSFANVAWCHIMTPGKIPTTSPEEAYPRPKSPRVYDLELLFKFVGYLGYVPGVGKVARWSLDDGLDGLGMMVLFFVDVFGPFFL